MNNNFFTDHKVTRVMNAVAAGTTDQNGTGVDMAEFDWVVFLAGVGALTATQVTALHAQQSADNGSVDAYSDLAGTLVGPLADGDGNKMLGLAINRPTKRYVRPVLDRATANAVIDFVVAIQGRGRNPFTQSTTLADHTIVASPDEGTP